jgi:hypothetical protein
VTAEPFLPEQRAAGPDGEQAAVAARLRGAAEALSVLGDRSPAERHRASRFAMGLLSAHVRPADWTSAGLPPPPELPPRATGRLLPVGHEAVLRLAGAAMRLYCAELRAADRPGHWARLEKFFAQHLPDDARARKATSLIRELERA